MQVLRCEILNPLWQQCCVDTFLESPGFSQRNELWPRILWFINDFKSKQLGVPKRNTCSTFSTKVFWLKIWLKSGLRLRFPLLILRGPEGNTAAPSHRTSPFWQYPAGSSGGPLLASRTKFARRQKLNEGVVGWNLALHEIQIDPNFNLLCCKHATVLH